MGLRPELIGAHFEVLFFLVTGRFFSSQLEKNRSGQPLAGLIGHHSEVVFSSHGTFFSSQAALCKANHCMWARGGPGMKPSGGPAGN